MAFLLNSQTQGVSGKTEQSTQTPWRGAPKERGPMQLHRLKAGPGADHSIFEKFHLNIPILVTASSLHSHWNALKQEKQTGR